MALSKAEREEFLAEPHIAALSVAAGPDRGPLTVPIWYDYTPGAQAWVLTGKTSRKAELIRAAGRFTLMVEQSDPRIRYVSVDGSVAREQPSTPELLRTMAARYLPPEKVDGYLEMADSEHEENVVFYLQPEHWLSADLGAI
ncbi:MULTISPECIES: pyridoxamine 5'-phosphate oxidase family protein [unclassified Rhodococcus (in: high G+C Gram-positive bacteria)]|uniref:pyridoxamine 5'-phosphate oxidase family protein n=1 Tax=unclassified Rhodococcus (in: high G+C Gram-positive bacteria) TaxID=192944 RepID=UPI0007BB79FD|nr:MULTISPECIES: pyridoxamine 5'-phosphate oxidase family protein [unclassified Rhodococcus (in: high G+C Gram-positive bacteria)]KZF07050.1 pyridoxamine 5'-phosphate oxidase [Rhodococcus sp. EPR-279]KZF08819.1 pyridoxamine 5'-phosphate oxidase [Rhodococcus sp. EPR-147]